MRITRRVRPGIRIVVLDTWGAGRAMHHVPEADVYVDCDGRVDLPLRLLTAVG